jgi:gas vesicle protein
MSEETTRVEGKFSITRKIGELLKLGSVGKLDSFFSKILKRLKKDIVAIKKNIDTMKFQSEQELDTLKDKLEDAQDALSEAYMSVSPEQVSTNALQTEFADTYLRGISSARKLVESIEGDIKTNKEDLKDDIKKDEARISKRELDIKAINEA